MTHESQEEDRSTKEGKGCLEGLEGKTNQEREDLGRAGQGLQSGAEVKTRTDITRRV